MLHKIQNRIPVLLSILGYFYILSPIGYYAYFMAKSGKQVWDVIGILTYTNNSWFLIQFIAIMLITPVVGLGLVLKRKWGLRLFFFYGAALIILNALNYSTNSELFNIWQIVGNIGLLLLLLLFTRLELQAPFYRPDWEKRARRHKKTVQIQYSIDESTIKSTTVDISEEGCFVSADELPATGARVNVILDPDGKKIHCKGKAAWVTQMTRRFPSGFGIMFDPLDDATIDQISTLIAISER